jgi:hypothetical protein
MRQARANTVPPAGGGPYQGSRPPPASTYCNTRLMGAPGQSLIKKLLQEVWVFEAEYGEITEAEMDEVTWDMRARAQPAPRSSLTRLPSCAARPPKLSCRRVRRDRGRG